MRSIVRFDSVSDNCSASTCLFSTPSASGRPAVKESDHRHRRLLRVRGERPCYCRAAEKCDEFPPPHGAYPKAKDHGQSIAGLGVLSGAHRNKKRRGAPPAEVAGPKSYSAAVRTQIEPRVHGLLDH